MVMRSVGSGPVKRIGSGSVPWLSPESGMVWRMKARGSQATGFSVPRRKASPFGKLATPWEFDMPKPRVTLGTTTNSALLHSRRPMTRSIDSVLRLVCLPVSETSPE